MSFHFAPARSSDPIYLKREEDISFVSSLTTVIIERVFDGLTMLLFVFLALPFVPSMPSVYRRLVTMLTVLLLAATAVFIWMAMRPQRVIAFYELVRWSASCQSKSAQWLTSSIERFMAGWVV